MAAPALAERALPQARRVAAWRRAWRTAAAWLICLAGLAACAAPGPAPRPDDGPRSRTAYVVGNGWHTAIVMPRDKAAATGLLPEAADFPDAAYLEFGWGDRDYYPAAEKTLGDRKSVV